MSHRLFVGLAPPAHVRQALLALADPALPGARWQTDAQLHLTLCFIGEVDRHTANDLAERLAELRAPRFDATLTPLGVFDRRGRVNTLWAGVAPREPLAALASRIARIAESAGARPERRHFTPHITIARFGAGGPPREALAPVLRAAVPPLHWVWEKLTLYESFLGSGGSHYAPVLEAPLAQGPML